MNDSERRRGICLRNNQMIPAPQCSADYTSALAARALTWRDPLCVLLFQRRLFVR